MQEVESHIPKDINSMCNEFKQFQTNFELSFFYSVNSYLTIIPPVSLIANNSKLYLPFS